MPLFHTNALTAVLHGCQNMEMIGLAVKMLRFLFRREGPVRSMLSWWSSWSTVSSSIYASPIPLSQRTAATKVMALWVAVKEFEIGYWFFWSEIVAKMVLRTHTLSGFVLFTTIHRSFGFLSSGSFPIKTAVCFSASFLPSALAGLLGYGYGEGSCAAYPFRFFKKKYNPAAERSTNQIMESSVKQL